MIHINLDYDTTMAVIRYFLESADSAGNVIPYTEQAFSRIGFCGKDILFGEIKRGLFGTKMKSAFRWNLKDKEISWINEKEVESEFLDTPETPFSNNVKKFVVLLLQAMRQVNLDGGELTAAFADFCDDEAFPFMIERTPLKRGIKILDKNRQPSSIEELAGYVLKM